jgi:hypothetical protein
MSTSNTVEALPDRKKRRTWLRVLGLIVFTIIGAVAAKGRPANGVFYHSTGELIGALVIGALIAFIFLAIVGSIG